jgi:quercetin dioxygenase-like cupin family protein
MTENSVKKVNQNTSPTGDMGQVYLASGKAMAMRMWDETPADRPKPTSQREYETVGYVLEGRAELHLDGQMVTLEPGDSWVVPKDAPHTYRVLEGFKALEVTSPPARFYSRDAN